MSTPHPAERFGPAELPLPASPASFEPFYRATLAPLRSYLFRVLGCRHEAQDIAHDAYLRTYAAMHRQPVEKPQAFLFTTARHLALNYRQRRARRMEPTESAALERAAGAAPDAAQAAVARQEAEAFDAAVLALPPACRHVLVLRIHEGLSHATIAARLGIAHSTVANHLSRAFRLLRENPASRPAGDRTVGFPE